MKRSKSIRNPKKVKLSVLMLLCCQVEKKQDGSEAAAGSALKSEATEVPVQEATGSESEELVVIEEESEEEALSDDQEVDATLPRDVPSEKLSEEVEIPKVAVEKPPEEVASPKPSEGSRSLKAKALEEDFEVPEEVAGNQSKGTFQDMCIACSDATLPGHLSYFSAAGTIGDAS